MHARVFRDGLTKTFHVNDYGSKFLSGIQFSPLYKDGNDTPQELRRLNENLQSTWHREGNK